MKRLIVLFALMLTVLGAVALVSCGGGGGGGTANNNGIDDTNNDTKTISGTILDSDGNPMPQASVIINGTAVGTTDDSGRIQVTENVVGSGVFDVEVVCDGISLYTTKASIDGSGSGKTFQIKSKTNSGDGSTEKVLSLSGVVYESGSDPAVVIANAQVILHGANELVFVRRSTPTGYAFYNVPAGNYKLISFKPGYDLNATDVTIGATASTQDIYLIANGTNTVGVETYTVKGTVTDEAGNPLEGAQIDFFLRPNPAKPALGNPDKPNGAKPPKPDDNRWGKNGFEDENTERGSSSYDDVPPADIFRQTLTDASGNYEFTQLNALGGELYATLEGYRPQRVSFFFTGDAEYTVNFTLKQLVFTSVSGTVVNGSGSPIEGAHIRFAAIDDKFVPPTEEGSSTSSVGKKGGEHDAFGPGGKPRPGVLGFVHAVTDAEGKYSIEKILVGGYYVSVHALKYQGYGEEVTLDTNPATLDFTLSDIGFVTISGKVVDTNGAPIAGANVHIGRANKIGKPDIFKGGRGASSVDDKMPPLPEDKLGPGFTVTDENGLYTLTDVPVIDPAVFINANKPGYLPNGVELAIEAGKTYSDVNLILAVRPAQPSIIAGLVLDTAGKPIANAYVSVSSVAANEDSATVTYDECYTDPRGHYVLRSTQGDVLVNATKEGFEDYHQPFVVGPKQNKLIITLSETAE